MCNTMTEIILWLRAVARSVLDRYHVTPCYVVRLGKSPVASKGVLLRTASGYEVALVSQLGKVL